MQHQEAILWGGVLRKLYLSTTLLWKGGGVDEEQGFKRMGHRGHECTCIAGRDNESEEPHKGRTVRLVGVTNSSCRDETSAKCVTIKFNDTDGAAGLYVPCVGPVRIDWMGRSDISIWSFKQGHRHFHGNSKTEHFGSVGNWHGFIRKERFAVDHLRKGVAA